MIRTYIDETSVSFGDADSDSLRNAIEDFVAVTTSILDRGREHDDESLLKVASIFNAKVRPGCLLLDFLYPAQGEPALRDARQQLRIAIDRIPTIEPSNTDHHLELSSSDRPILSPDLARELLDSYPRSPVPVLALATAGLCGSVEVTLNGASTCLWFVTTAESRTDFFRAWLASNPPAPHDFEDFLGRAFPRLEWCDGAANGLRTNKSLFFGAHFPTTLVHLAVLNDDCAQLFTEETNNAKREKLLDAVGVSASPESPNTRKSATKAAQRRREWKGREVHFWWHTKIRYNHGRIHFYHEPRSKDEAPTYGTIIVGICTDHLQT